MLQRASPMAGFHCRVLICCLLALPSVAFAHGTKVHEDKPAASPKPLAPPAESRSAERAGAPNPAASPTEPRNSDAAAAQKPVAAPKPHRDEPASAPKPVGSRTASQSTPEAAIEHAPGKTSAQPEAHAATLPRVDTSTLLSIDTLIDDLSFSEFPTLHPLVVHVPVTFIPLAFVFALIGLLVVHRALIWLAFVFTLGGLGGGLVAAFPMHPHTSGLSKAASATLQKHDFFAYGTLWLALVAVVVALVCLWKPARLSMLCLVLVLLLAAASVAVTGHYGGTLAYVHGVGVQGQYLSPH